MSEDQCLREGCERRTGRRRDGTGWDYCSLTCRGLDTELSWLQARYERQQHLPSEPWAALVNVCDEWTEYQRVKAGAFRQLR